MARADARELVSALSRYYAERDATTDLGPHRHRLHRLVLELEARQVIELGVRRGASTLALLAALELTGGRLWSVDVDPWHEHLRGIADHPAWHLEVADDLEAAPRSPSSCDLLFIDTSHELEHTRAELEAYGPRVRAGGRIALHDVDPDPRWDAMTPALEYARRHELAVDYYPGSFGLAVLRVQ